LDRRIVEIMSTSVACAGVAALILAVPFEALEPLVRITGLSITSAEAVLLGVLAAWAVAIVATRTWPAWRTPLTFPWIVFLLAMLVAALLAPAERVNAVKMVGRLGIAFAVFLLTVIAATSAARLRVILWAAAAGGGLSAAIIALDYSATWRVHEWLLAFRSHLAHVGAQARPSGSFQYPTIASMYLEIVFALALPLLLVAVEERRRTAALLLALVLIAILQAINLTFTRAGLVATLSSLAIVGALRYRVRGWERGGAVVALLTVLALILPFSTRSSEAVALRFSSEGQQDWYRALIEAPPELSVKTGQTLSVPLVITNSGLVTWYPGGRSRSRLSYHWLLPDGDRIDGWEGLRTDFPGPVAPGDVVRLEARLRTPNQPGRYRLMWDVEQEHRFWFSTESGAERYITAAEVSGPRLGPDGPRVRLPERGARVHPSRRVFWQAVARMTVARPLTGVGPDNFRLRYGEYADLREADPRLNSHNMFLEVLAGGGVLGAAAFGWLLWRIVMVLRSAIGQRAGSWLPLAASGAVAASAAIAVHGIFDSFLSFTATYVLFAVTLGMATSCGALAGTAALDRAA
jgi:O-antigen ligase